MGLFNQIVAAGCGDHLDVLHRVEHGKLTQGRTIAPEFVGVDDLRRVVLSQEPTKERFSRLGIAVLLKENV